MLMRLWLAALVCASCSGVGHPANPIELDATSDWTVDYGEERCSLSRDFGELDQGLGLRIDSYGRQDSLFCR